MFEGDRILIVGLCEIVLPNATVRLCDGGYLDWPGRGTFHSIDPVFGTLGPVDPLNEAIGDEAPGGSLTLLPPTLEAAVALAQPTAQGSTITFWMAEANPDSGMIVGEPEQLFIGELDTVTLIGREGKVRIEYVSAAERLFRVAEGNVLSDRFHQKAWPGETGFSQCTGTALAVPWGVTGPPRGSTGGFGGGIVSSGGGGGTLQQVQMV